MGRRRKQRRVAQMPPVEFYKPQGVPMHRLTGMVLPVEGLEAMRLVDAEGLSQEEAAARMDVSTPTLCRILADGRAIVARALSMGRALRIEGGDFNLEEVEPLVVDRPGRGPGGGRGRRGRGGRGGWNQEGGSDE
jgi:predicted DNA-binding protein (UPF0251 family)